MVRARGPKGPRVQRELAQEEERPEEESGQERPPSSRGTATTAGSGVIKQLTVGPSRVSNPTSRVKEEEIRKARIKATRKEEKERRVRQERQGP